MKERWSRAAFIAVELPFRPVEAPKLARLGTRADAPNTTRVEIRRRPARIGKISKPNQLQNAFHVGLRKIASDIQQAAVMRFGDFIGETVTEIQPR